MSTHPVCCHYKTDAILWVIKVAISEFGLLMLMVILLNHYMFIEVMRYLHDNKWFESQ